ncbi:transposase [Bacteroides acidifaciens]
MIVVIVKNFLRSIFESILYILVSGCQWRMLPKDFPKWKTVYRHFSG